MKGLFYEGGIGMAFLKKVSTEETMSDEKIVDLYFSRDENAIKQTDLKYRKYLLGVAEYFVHNAQDSEECLNDTYLGAWNSMPPARPKILQAFLTSIMRRVAVSCYRTKNSKKRIPAEFIDSLSDLDDIIDENEDMEREYNARELGECISSFVRSLSERQIYIFVGRYYFLRSVGEIADALGVSRSTVNKEIAAIKTGLRQKLESEGYSI